MSQAAGSVTLMNVYDLKVKMAGGALVNLRGRLHTSRAKGGCLLILMAVLWLVECRSDSISDWFGIIRLFMIKLKMFKISPVNIMVFTLGPKLLSVT